MPILLLVFGLGVINFSLHKAVLESRHPMVERMPWMARGLGKHGTLAVEFLVLLGAMWLTSGGHPGWAWAYAGYTWLNGLTAWLILTRRV